MSTPTPRVRVPAKAKKGEVVEVKTLISHDMESGQRRDADGKTIPRKIIHSFAASFNGKPVFKADWHPGISANPYQSFFAKVEESGTFEFAWTEDGGAVFKTAAKIEVA